MPMESLLLPVITDLLMQKLEKTSLLSIFFYYRYIDDLFAAVPFSEINSFFFNSFHS